jgi:autotransporter-associated beta strand protein
LGTAATTGTLSANSAISNDGTLIINRSNAVVQGTDFSASPLAGVGSFVQAGTGTTTLTAANTYTGFTTVNAGTLLVNGSISGNTTQVFTGGTLGGTGTVGEVNVFDGIPGSRRQCRHVEHRPGDSRFELYAQVRTGPGRRGRRRCQRFAQCHRLSRPRRHAQCHGVARFSPMVLIA